VNSKNPAINLGKRTPPVKLGAKYNGKNPQGRPIGHTTETANKDKILIACNPDFSTAPSALLKMTKGIRAQDSNSGASSTL